MTLVDICKREGIRFDNVNYDNYRDCKPSSGELLSVMNDLNNITSQDAIFIGGQSVHSFLLGYRQMRRPSSDIDCVTTEKGICSLYNHFGDRVFYSIDHGDLFIDYEGVPVGFVTDKIHDWIIPSDFRDSSVSINVDGSLFNVAPAEYTIMLKMRRGFSKGRFFGKDSLDIINLLLAPYFRETLSHVDLEKTSNLVHKYVSNQESVLRFLFESIFSKGNYLRKEERGIFDGIMNQFEHYLLNLQ